MVAPVAGMPPACMFAVNQMYRFNGIDVPLKPLVTQLVVGAQASVTVSVVEPKIEPNCAAIWVVPDDIPVATPFEPAALDMTATSLALDDQVTMRSGDRKSVV